MNFLLGLAWEVRVALAFALGCALAGFVNLATYSWSYAPRPYSPWSRLHPRDGGNPWLDRLPLVGWWRLRRKSAALGDGFWRRPLAVEILLGTGMAALYWWEVGRQGLLPQPLPGVAGVEARLHLVFVAHALLVTLMSIATLIDIDELTIPDLVTVPGTLLGLLLATLIPHSLLPVISARGIAPPELEFLTVASPRSWPAALAGRPVTGSLILGLACYGIWCAALLPRRWRARRGYWHAARVAFARIARERLSLWILGLAVVGSVAIASVWWQGGTRWTGLLSALVGIAGGGGLVWLVRIVGTWALDKEAMGFGDVTLLAMIGGFLGWQPCLLIFFLAPFAGLIIGLVQLVIYRDNVVPYGPFLCLATVGVICNWAALWQWSERLFEIGWLVPLAIAICLVALGALLGIWRIVRQMLFG